MSVDATRWAWRAHVKNATQRLILLSLADRAGEHHTCYPSNKRLAEDTMLNLKTVQKSVCELIELGLIADTGERKGNTNQIRVLQLIGVDSRECNEPKNGAVKQTQKRNSTKIGNDTKNGIGNEPKNGLGNLPIEPINESININTAKPAKFSFANELKKLGADNQMINDWMLVRKNKKASNSETSFKNFMTQVEKSKLPLNTILEICIVRDWKGFNASWLSNINLSEYQSQQASAPENYTAIEGDW
ncbi:helix-turn-helix domain-containing protein [Acinetobacter towneri]|uniref:helix-turn-helix domain-containing protein n=1 Tax=Acinetobacter towneri TaxID=202956 RepID=UPI00257733E9|nr:helix-turn-helix domain-containing protein [Acinetobacter towneri]